MEIILYIIILIAAFAAMEFVAWFVHRYIMHGFLWVLHEDHHNQTKGFFQKNDSFFLIFSVPSIIFIIVGVSGVTPLIFSGLGIALYGFAYFLVHEVLIHRRFPKLRKALFGKTQGRYLKVLQYAHKMHHKHLKKEDGESFGMLVVHPKYYEKVRA